MRHRRLILHCIFIPFSFLSHNFRFSRDIFGFLHLFNFESGSMKRTRLGTAKPSG